MMARKPDDQPDDPSTDDSAGLATETTGAEPTGDDGQTGPLGMGADAEPTTEVAQTALAGQDDTDNTGDSDEIDSGAKAFSRPYVEKLRRENATYRERASKADELAKRLHTALVEATGRLADPTDMAYDAAHLDDPAALAAAIDELLAAKPHLATRRPFGDVGQGNRGSASEPVNLHSLLRARA